MDIRLQNVTKVFQAKDKSETVAVKGFNVTIPSGKLIGLLGPSGCGKSTTLYMIAGLLDPTEGRIFFGEDDVTDIPPEERGIGLVFQNYALYPHMSVRQNIMFPLENIKVPKQEALERAQEMADLVGIGELMDRKPKQLSGGQQQRVAIARALVKKPRVLLLDEPLSNLDARLRLQTREEIKRIQRETGITTVFVTHDQEEAMSISDQIVLMELGVKQQVGEPQDVYDKPENLFVAKFLGTPPINIFDADLKDGSMFLGEFNIGKAPKGSTDILVGIRPEGFIVKKDKGTLTVDVYQVETIGRDTTLIIKDPTAKDKKTRFRAIVDSAHRIQPGDTIKLDIKPAKIFIFDKATGAIL
ncbi:ABC transporter ATP-binding protein [Candidatus Xianfuyuplasma coldseepsis]|uniref:ABC transporter ATP-binding protein n=1 Tax=Candidatus Xianfuyuplasma coldseepsis TaxID=2782163 RepID=A0A7L7KS10_9MOLU|nr:ABC transporter ATP-binding protein [Xianfuyuplasma coldseepsis]QMS84976.1 ABC transporter ATP-binding protein [Xianfuyuplasma coldseepsis]